MLRFQRAAPFAALLAALSLTPHANAQSPAPAKPPATKPSATTAAPSTNAAPTTSVAPADRLVAKVNDVEIHVSDVDRAYSNLPSQAKQVPKERVMPQVVREVIDSKALLIEAKQRQLDHDPEVARAIADAADRALISALLAREVQTTVTDAAVTKKYDDEVAGKPGEDEVRVRQILVATEDEAKAIITQIKSGGDFAAIARDKSSDATASRGGDVGFVKVSRVLPALAPTVAALKPGEMTPTPVRSRFGWHVIKLEERRTSPTPTFDEAKDGLRQALVQDAIRAAATAAREKVKIEMFNEDGTSSNRSNSSIIPSAFPPANK